MSIAGVANIKVECIMKDGIFDITQLVNYAKWEGDILQAYRSLELMIFNTEDGRDRKLDIRIGDKVTFYNHDVELFRGRIFTQNYDISGQELLRCYDNNIYLTKNATTEKFTSKTATQITQKLCNDYGIVFGDIENTGYVIPKIYPREKSLYDIIIMALSETRNKTGRKFIVYSDNGKLYLAERRKQAVQWILENGVNILDASYSISIEDLRNRVKIIGGTKEKGEFIGEASDSKSASKYGLMQHIERANGDATKSQVVQMAQAKLKELNTANDEATVSALGINDVISKRAVYLNENMTNLFGGYYVQHDTHTFETGSHTMSLIITATDELPKMEIEIDE